jgi:hypothetical protein
MTQPAATPPPASKHQRRRRSRRSRFPFASIYAAELTVAELQRIATYYRDPTLIDEVAALRVVNRRLLALLNPQSSRPPLSLRQWLLVYSAISVNNNRIARLLRIQHDLAQAAAPAQDSTAHFLAVALRELSASLAPADRAEMDTLLHPGA